MSKPAVCSLLPQQSQKFTVHCLLVVTCPVAFTTQQDNDRDMKPRKEFTA